MMVGHAPIELSSLLFHFFAINVYWGGGGGRLIEKGHGSDLGGAYSRGGGGAYSRKYGILI